MSFLFKNRSEWGRFLIIALVATLIPILLIAPQSHSQSPQQIKQDDEAVRQVMLTWSRQLNVTCTTCHNPNNFKEVANNNFKVAKDHARLVQVLIDNGMDGNNGRPKADCFMCHRGELKPAYQEKIDPLSKTHSKSQ
ncbi:MAG: photosynthetic reaction center cytochrome c subunit family protein [Pseudobdellovibrionaceae bacterium]